MQTTLAPATVTVVYRHAAAVFAAAVRDRLIVRTPCVGIRLPRAEPRRVTPERISEILNAYPALLDAVPDQYRAFVVVGAGAGLRLSEALGLTVDRVGFLHRMLRIDRQLVTPPGKGNPAFGPLKSTAAARTIPLADVVADELAEHLRRYPSEDLLFTTACGGPIRRQRVRDWWVPAVEHAGVPGLRYHDLRHLYASALIRFGESVKTVQARLGHASAVETLDVYAALWPDSEDRSRAAVDALLPRTIADSPRTEPAL
jgi:integrase